MDIIAQGNLLRHLDYLMEFLAAWEKRPESLTPMAYQWCSAISEAAAKLKQKGTFPSTLETGLRTMFREQQALAIDEVPDFVSSTVEGEFSQVGPSCELVRFGETLFNAWEGTLEVPIPPLLVALEIGFRLTTPTKNQPAHHLDHTEHHQWVFEAVFAGDKDEAIADVVSVWIAGGSTPPGSYVCYFAKRVRRDEAFSPRLRQAAICVIEHIWDRELEASVLDTVYLLNRLDAKEDDMEKKGRWAQLLISILCLPEGLQNLSPHYWSLLGNLEWYDMMHASQNMDPNSHSEVAKSLQKTKDWEKLEVWMWIVWRSMRVGDTGENIKEVTRDLLLQQPLALPKFKELCETNKLHQTHKSTLQQICDQVEALQPLYASVCIVHYLSVLILPFTPLL